MLLKVVNEFNKESYLAEAANIKYVKKPFDGLVSDYNEIIGEQDQKSGICAIISFYDIVNKVDKEILVLPGCSCYIMNNEAKTIEVIRLLADVKS